MTIVVALRDIYSSFRSIGTRSKGDRFPCEDWLADELEAIGDVRKVEGTQAPKDERALPAGRNTPQSSSRPVQVSTKRRSRT